LLAGGLPKRDHEGAASLRTVEAHRLVCWGRRWYPIAWDTQRLDWRTFPADRINPRTPTDLRFPPRDPPDGDVAAYVTRNVESATWRYRASVRLHAPADVVAAKLPFTLGPVQALEENMCLLNAGSDNPHMLAVHLGMLDVDFEITDPPELVTAFRKLADRYQSATRPST
jgi:predicted DNA-binding transcriptional regulator YafY